MRFGHFQGEKHFACCLPLCFHCSWRRMGFVCWPRFLRSASVLSVVLLEAVPSFSALSALSAFRFSASGRASGSVFRVIRVIRLPVFCFWLCFWKRFPRSPRYLRSGALRSVIVVGRVLLAYGDHIRSGGGSRAQKWRFWRQRNMWTAVHRQLPDAWPQVFRLTGHERLVGVQWRVWAANSPCPPVVVLPRRTSHPSWEAVAVLWGWVAVRGTGGHVFTAPRGTVIETDGGMALQLTAEPLTTHVVVGVLQWGADRPQPWRDPVARAVWRDVPILRATVWSGGAGRHLPGALPWLRDYGDASPPPAELRGALESLYSKPRHHFVVAADHGVELSDDVVALAADVVQCLAPPAVMLPREGWEG